MKTNDSHFLTLPTYPRLLAATLLTTVSLLTLSSCKKEPETVAVPVEVSPVTTAASSSQAAQTAQIKAVEDKAAAEHEIDLAALENNIGAASANPSAETTTPNPEQAIKGTQITDVQYRSQSGATMTVVFETSATGVLNAIVSLPNKAKMTLSAPEGQGNNPTYRSKDGSVELVSHGGGGNIDLMQEGQLTSFEAVSVEAEVITQS